MQYRLIALDVDGTLINDQFQIMPKTKEILKDCYQNGMMIALCTGRGAQSTIPLMEELGAEGPIVVHNGAIILHSHTKEIYDQIALQRDELRELVQFCRDRKLHMDISTADQVYVESITPELAVIYREYYSEPIVVPDILELEDEIIRLAIIADEAKAITEELRKRFSHLRITQSGENYIDVIHTTVSKGEGTARLVKKLGITLDQVIAFGNYYNDLELLASVGLGIAMENSPEEVKMVAKEVTRSNNDEGIYYALKKILYS